MKYSPKKEKKGGGNNISTSPGNNQQAKITPMDLETILMNYCPDNNQELRNKYSHDNQDQASIKPKSILKGRENASLSQHKRVSMCCIYESKEK